MRFFAVEELHFLRIYKKLEKVCFFLKKGSCNEGGTMV